MLEEEQIFNLELKVTQNYSKFASEPTSRFRENSLLAPLAFCSREVFHIPRSFLASHLLICL